VNRTTDRLLLGSILALGAGLAWVVAGSLEEPVTKVGDRAPQFKVVTDSGKTLTPTNFGGKLLVLNFWATWCPGCVQEMTALDRFQRELAPQGVVVVGVSMDANENLYKRFLSQYPLSIETARDPSWEIAASYGTFQLPETYIIDQSGRVVQKVIAAHNFMDPAFLDSIRRLL
jgi:peroxiredoxin